jgi:SAM-dependent methyltransferase
MKNIYSINGMNRLELLKLDAKYYDVEKAELKEIMKNTNPKRKIVLDVGAGVGRFAFPLAKKTAKIIALDIDKSLNKHYLKNKVKNLEFVNESIQKFSKKTSEKFDIILISWCPSHSIKYLKKISNKNTIIVILSPFPNSDYDKMINKFASTKSYFEKKGIIESFKILKSLNKEVKVVYPSEKEAIRAILADIKIWWKKSLDKEQMKILRAEVNIHKVGKKVIFMEKTKIRFMILK